LRGLRGESRLLTQVDLGSSLSGFAVEDCEGAFYRAQAGLLTPPPDCTIWLLGSLRALRLRHLSSVRLIALAVDGAVYAEHCNACALHIAAAQLRVHDSERSAFYAVRYAWRYRVCALHSRCAAAAQQGGGGALPRPRVCPAGAAPDAAGLAGGWGGAGAGAPVAGGAGRDLGRC